METKEYQDENPMTMASETAVAYQKVSPLQTRIGRNQSMSVDEYFDKVRKALDKRYENL